MLRHGNLVYCEPHYIWSGLTDDVNYWSLAENTTEEWLRVAREWGHADLIWLAESAHGMAERAHRDAEKRADEVQNLVKPK